MPVVAVLETYIYYTYLFILTFYILTWCVISGVLNLYLCTCIIVELFLFYKSQVIVLRYQLNFIQHIFYSTDILHSYILFHRHSAFLYFIPLNILRTHFYSAYMFTLTFCVLHVCRLCVLPVFYQISFTYIYVELLVAFYSTNW